MLADADIPQGWTVKIGLEYSAIIAEKLRLGSSLRIVNTVEYTVFFSDNLLKTIFAFFLVFSIDSWAVEENCDWFDKKFQN